MTVFYASIFTVLLICLFILGWTLRGFLNRFENMEQVIKRRELPNTVKAGLEDVWSLADMARMLQGNSQDRLIGLAMLLKQQILHDEATSAVLDAILKDTAQLRRDPKGYDHDKPLSDR